MSFVDAPTLRSALLALSRLRRSRGRLDDAVAGCALAGSWLRTFQERSGESDRPVRQGSREEVIHQLRAYGEFLDSRPWRRVATAGAARVTQLLPHALPVTVGHGDFAPRNMLLRDGLLTVIDPLPRWQVPVYDDLCRFLVGIRLIGEQVHTHGLAFGVRHARRARGRRRHGVPRADRRPRAVARLPAADPDGQVDRDARQPSPRRAGRLARRSASLADHRVRAEAERLLDLAGATR